MHKDDLGSRSALVELLAGWNMFSLPVEPTDTRIKTLFPEADAVFAYTTKYILLDPNDPLEIGKGYWLYLPQDDTYSITGLPIDAKRLVNDRFMLLSSRPFSK